MEKTIYDLKLHESLIVENKTTKVAWQFFTVLRVPGGWLYQTWSDEEQKYIRETFVPLNTEFLYDDSKS